MTPSHKFTGSETHTITLAEATALTAVYRSGHPDTSFSAEAFGRDAILRLLIQDGARGMRVYLAQKDSTPRFVIVAIDSNGTDLVQGMLIETGFPCPPFCDFASPLLH